MDREKRPNISAENKRRLYNLFPTIFTVMIVVIMAAAPKHDTWFRRIYDFQGLIGGFFAILAAYVTIYQMRISDERSDRRHLDILRTSRLADERRVERSVNPARNHLAEDFDTLQQLGEDATSATDRGDFLRSRYDTLDQIVTSMLATMETPEFKAGMELFDGDLAYFIRQTLNSLRQLAKFQESIPAVSLKHPADIERMLDLLGDATLFGEFIIHGLDQIARDFGVQITE